jgi:hypothetical protein
MTHQILKIFTENNDFQYIETLKRNCTKRAKSGKFGAEGVIYIRLPVNVPDQILCP